MFSNEMNTGGGFEPLLVRFAWIGAVASAVWSVLWLAMGVPALTAVNVVFAVLFVGVLRRRRQLGVRRAINLVVALSYGTITLQWAVTGGVAGPGGLWLYVLPVVCALFFAPRASAFWGAGLVGTMILFWGLALAGIELPNLVPGEHALVDHALSSTSVLIVIILLSLLYAQLQTQTVARLERANEELQHAYVELRQSQQQLLISEKMAALGRVTAGIAHEINSPLGGILNSLQLARELGEEYERSLGDADVSADDHRQIARELKDALAVGEFAAARVGEFVRSIKAHTRVQTAVMDSIFELDAEIATTMTLLDHLLRQAGVKPVFAVERGLRVRGDAHRFALVLQNLVSNAVDAYGESGGELHVRAYRRDGAAVLQVEDFGCGIADEIRHRIFDYLFTTKDVGRGTGLGLSMVHDLVTSHFGGAVAVVSEPGRGSTFTVSLPIAAEAAEHA